MLPKLKSMAISASLAATMALSSRVVYGEAETVFPMIGKSETSSFSPNRRYSLYDEDRDQVPYHSLLLKEKTNGTSIKILDFNRHVEVSWKSDSRYFYINNYYASDASDCMLFSVRPLKGVGVTQILQKYLHSKARNLASGPLYITCAWWQVPTILEIKVSGFEGSGKHQSRMIKHYRFDVSTDSIVS